MKLNAAARLLASEEQNLTERIFRQAQAMDRLPRSSKEYMSQQFIMQRLLRELHKINPGWEDSAFDPLVWSHTGKPPRVSRGLLRADTALDKESGQTDFDGLVDPLEDPLSTGVAFDTLIDGEPGAATPAVQELTDDDGTVKEAPEQDLLMDDLNPSSIQYG